MITLLLFTILSGDIPHEPIAEIDKPYIYEDTSVATFIKLSMTHDFVFERAVKKWIKHS